MFQKANRFVRGLFIFDIRLTLAITTILALVIIAKETGLLG